jgi:hypothetical protein
MNEEKAEFDFSSKDGKVRITIKTQSVEHLFSLSAVDAMRIAIAITNQVRLVQLENFARSLK